MKQKEHKIAIVANMSAGKSTFINAMFGDDILPSYHHATTDCPLYIYSENKEHNHFAKVEFYGTKKSILLNGNEIKSELKKYAKKDSLVDDYRYKSVKQIELHYPFYSLVNKKNSNSYFTIIDTSGSNNKDEYGERHSSTTKEIILNEADKLVYLFDYTQIDANLEVEKENLWGLIQKRKEVDENFEVYFVINKIDKALEDNRKLREVVASKSEEEYLVAMKKNWFHHEKKAIEKIRTVAKKVGFYAPKISCVSAEYQKLDRMETLSFDQEDNLERFQKIFKKLFENDWEQRFDNYTRLESSCFIFFLQ